MSLGLLMGLAVTAHADVLKPVAERAEVANFTLNNLKGEAVKLSELRGRVVVVNFWATWCNPCIQELPFLNKYYNAHKDDGLVILAISTDGPETLAKVKSTVKRRRWKLPILLDQAGDVLADLNPRGQMPYTLFLDRDGRLAADHDGYTAGDEAGMLKTIEALLAEKPAVAKPAAAAPVQAGVKKAE
jgi:peroxiredoxin